MSFAKVQKFIVVSSFLIILLLGCSKQQLNFPDATPLAMTLHEAEFPDFSYAGYMQNEQELPLVPTTIMLEPGGDNDRELIQHAIDELAQKPLIGGFRGAILLKRGEYFIDNTLFIRSSGIVLRGEGQGENGTILHATNTAEKLVKPGPVIFSHTSRLSDFPFIHVAGGAEQISQSNAYEIQNNIKAGRSEIELESVGAFSQGDMILIKKKTNQAWIDIIGMEQFGWTYDAYVLEHRRKIQSIRGNRLLLDVPMVDNIWLSEGGGTVESISLPNRIQNVGIENMRIISTLEGSTPEHHTWIGIKLENTHHSWVRNITAKHFSFSAVSIHGKSDFNTVQDCAMLEPMSVILSPRRYHFYIAGGTGNLFQRCFSEAGRHDFATNSRVAGPNVFLDCLSINSSNDIGPHHRWASGILFDNISGARLTAHNRGAAGSGHGWVGVQIMFWNSHATRSFTVENPQNSVNWCIGCTGAFLSGNGYWASAGIPVSPRSLFIHQLDHRLGSRSTDKIISSRQRSEQNIWDELSAWRGSDQALVTMPGEGNY